MIFSINSIIFHLRLAVFFLLLAFTPTEAEEFEDTGALNSFGMPGEIDLPSAKNLPDGQFSVSSSMFGGTIRVNLSFQIFKDLTGAFRYARVPSSSGDPELFWDRNFDTFWYSKIFSFPSIAIGLRDFIGTGLYSGEYIVATKSFGSNLKITGGLGWGRLSGKNKFDNIFGLKGRGSRDVGLGGTFHFRSFFSGNNSPFLAVSYKINEKTQIISELSSDG